MLYPRRVYLCFWGDVRGKGWEISVVHGHSLLFVDIVVEEGEVVVEKGIHGDQLQSNVINNCIIFS